MTPMCQIKDFERGEWGKGPSFYWAMVRRECVWRDPIYLGPIISTIVGDTDLGPMEHLYEMTTWESNGHVTDDLT